MKVLKEKSREYKGKSYFKYKVNIPESALEKAGIKEGDELKIKTEKYKIVLEK